MTKFLRVFPAGFPSGDGKHRFALFADLRHVRLRFKFALWVLLAQKSGWRIGPDMKVAGADARVDTVRFFAFAGSSQAAIAGSGKSDHKVREITKNGLWKYLD